MEQCLTSPRVVHNYTWGLDIFADSLFYASAFKRQRHYVFGLSVRPSVRPKPEIPSFDLYMGPLVHPTNRYRFTACPSVRPSVRPSVPPERFPGICRRMHGRISLKFYMLMYLDHLQNWLVHGHGLLIFLILALFNPRPLRPKGYCLT